MTLSRCCVSCLCVIIAAAVLAGCSNRGRNVPLMERGAAAKRAADGRPQVYVIGKGDTLYSIAFNYGLDYREVAELNNIQNPDVIHIGQEIRLLPPGGPTTSRPVQESKPATESKPAQESKAQVTYVKEWPKAVRMNYSEQAMKQIEKMQAEIPKATPVIVAKVEDKKINSNIEGEGELEWGLPATGKMVGEFSESANRKGIDIAGKLGQAVVASAAGRVVYSGSGLRGYGKLVIIKHNKTYLSAYAHNDQVLVKEGQSVSKGQQIAAMGNTDSDQVKLHFEIRKYGKPVDPAKYLPL